MTNAPAPTAKPWAFWMKQLNQREFEQVQIEVAKDFAMKFRTKREVLMTALHLRNLPPEARLVHYRMRPPDMWMVLENVFPERYKENMLDWYSLESKDEAGELDPLKIDEAMSNAIQSAKVPPIPEQPL